VDAPSWEILRSAKCAANIYAPLGTMMSLGDYVRLVKAYIDVFGLAHAPAPKEEGEGKDSLSLREEDERIRKLCSDLKVIWTQFSPVILTFHHVGIPRSTSALGREGRQDQATAGAIYCCLPDDHSFDMVFFPSLPICPRSPSVDPCVLDVRVLCPQL